MNWPIQNSNKGGGDFAWTLNFSCFSGHFGGCTSALESALHLRMRRPLARSPRIEVASHSDGLIPVFEFESNPSLFLSFSFCVDRKRFASEFAFLLPSKSFVSMKLLFKCCFPRRVKPFPKTTFTGTRNANNVHVLTKSSIFWSVEGSSYVV